MIKTPISGKLECLKHEDIHHDLFISENYRELHLWDTCKLQETLILLGSCEVSISSVVKQEDFYIIRF